MIKYFCDKCGEFMDKDKSYDISIRDKYVRFYIDGELCEKCVKVMTEELGLKNVYEEQNKQEIERKTK